MNDKLEVQRKLLIVPVMIKPLHQIELEHMQNSTIHRHEEKKSVFSSDGSQPVIGKPMCHTHFAHFL